MSEQTSAAGIDGMAGTATDPLEMLMQDHRMVEQLFEQIKEASEDEREALVAQLREALDLHMELEEDYVYPVVREALGEEDGEEAQTEHDLAKTGLDQLEELVGQPGFGAALEMVKAGIKHHVTEEEEDIFPRLREEAGDQLQELGATMMAARLEYEQALAGGIDEIGDELDEDEAIDVTDGADSRKRRDRGKQRRDDRSKARGKGAAGGRADLAEMSKADLLERAKQADVKGRSSMTKDELVEALSKG